MPRIVIASVALLVITLPLAADEPKPIKVLIITGDHGHAWKETTPFLKKLLTKARLTAADKKELKSLDAQLGVAQCEIAEGNQAAALDQLKSLLLSHPKNPEVFDLLAQVYRSMGKDYEAQQAEARAKLLRQREIK